MSNSLKLLLEEVAKARKAYDLEELVGKLQHILKTRGMDPDKDLFVFVALDQLFGTNVTETYAGLLRMAARHGRVKAYNIVRDRAFAAFAEAARGAVKDMKAFGKQYVQTLLKLAEEAVKSERVVRQERTYTGVNIPVLGEE